MTVNFYLVVNQNGSIRSVKNQPSLHWDEISLHLKLSISNEVFVRPQFKAELTIPESAIQSTDIPVELSDQIQQVIQQTTGYEVIVELVATKKEVSHEGA